MREELVELEDALWIGSIHEIAKELCDLLYVVYYAANLTGIDIEPIFDLVHASNMTKQGADKTDTGKVTKGPNYVAPDLTRAILAQIRAPKDD